MYPLSHLLFSVCVSYNHWENAAIMTIFGHNLCAAPCPGTVSCNCYVNEGGVHCTRRKMGRKCNMFSFIVFECILSSFCLFQSLMLLSLSVSRMVWPFVHSFIAIVLTSLIMIALRRWACSQSFLLLRNLYHCVHAFIYMCSACTSVCAYMEYLFKYVSVHKLCLWYIFHSVWCHTGEE